MADDTSKESKEEETTEVSETKDTGPVKKKQKGLISRIWNGLFRIRGDDFEKRLQYISKEEATVLARLKKRSQRWRRTARNLIIFSVFAEVIAVGYAIMTTRTVDLDWKMRAYRVLPMFLLPPLSTLAYLTYVSFMKMCDTKDHKTLERLRAERQAKIDELKERTNYYTTQQLIQRYDPDPAAKAAAATVLASKLGADSGLQLYMRDDSVINTSAGKSNDVEYTQPGGLRHRKQMHKRSSSTGSTALQEVDLPLEAGIKSPAIPEEETQPVVVEHYQHQGSASNDGGWIARIAALLVGEDPTQSYALICGNCHMHNGLARKEEFPFITYYCPHCHALNRSKGSDDTPNVGSVRTVETSDPVVSSITSDALPASATSPLSPTTFMEEVSGSVKSEGTIKRQI